MKPTIKSKCRKKSVASRNRGYYSELVTANYASGGACGDHAQASAKPTGASAPPRDVVMSSWRAFQTNRSPDLGTIPKRDCDSATAYVVANDPWITFGRDHSILFPRESFAPKVQMSVEAEPRHLVRNVETERRRRMYQSFELERLFRDEGGIESTSVIADEHYLRLELFDDTEYDCRTPTEWLSLGMVNGKQHPIPAEALIKESRDRNSRWQPVAVIDYDEKTELYHLVALDGERRNYHLPRIYVRFCAEDPRLFVRRVVAALRLRNEADDGLRHHLQLTCMPYDNIGSLNDDDKNIIKSLAAREGSLLDRDDWITTTMREIERNYQQVMCDLECRNPMGCRRALFDVFEKSSISNNFTATMKNYSSVKSYIEWKNLYVHTEVYESMSTVADECERVAVGIRLFFTKLDVEPLTLEEFKDCQLRTIGATIDYLMNDWLASIEESVTTRLGVLGKGNYDLELGRYDVYERSKLMRFFVLVDQRMQTALRTLIEESSRSYVDYVEKPTLSVCDQKLDDDYEWDDNLRSDKFSRSHVITIFHVTVELSEQAARYRTDPRLFEKALITLYIDTLQRCQKIDQIYPRVMKNLKFPKGMYVKSVNLEEPLPSEVCARIHAAYEASIVPLDAYVRKYDRYCALFVIDPEKYAEDRMNEELTSRALREEIASHYASLKDLANDIPVNIKIGAFDVSVEKTKKILMTKRRKIAECLLTRHADRLRAVNDDILDNLRSIRDRLAIEPAGIEQLNEMREWMETLELLVSVQTERALGMRNDYDVLDYFWWNLSDEDAAARDETAKLPLLIRIKEAETHEVLLELEKKIFYKMQLEDEGAIADKIEALIGGAFNAMTKSNVTDAHEIAKEVKKLWESMKETEEFGFVLNARQKLFGVEVKPFKGLAKIIKDFEPYKSFWTACAEWLKWHDAWMNSPLLGIEGGNIDTNVADWHKTIARCIKSFHEHPDLPETANHVKDQIERFRPYVGIIQALRNPGMKTRHLQQISNVVGIDIVGSVDLTFANLLSRDITRFEDEIRAISEAAAKEYAIEEALNKMIDEWKQLKMDVVPYKETGMHIVKVSDELQILLDEHILNTQQLGFSQFKAAFEKEIDDWYSKLCLAKEAIVEWIEVQKIWMYLEPIFSSEDISRQLPTEAKKYSSMERNWRRITKQALDNPIIMQICPDKALLESLRECTSLLDTVQKGLADYLESRRLIFPRFFFLSDDELLEMLAQAKQPRAVQPHLKKCFESIKLVRFASDTAIARITHMCSAEGEEVALETVLEPKTAVEYWLGELEDAMRVTLRRSAERAIGSVEKETRRRWIFRWPGQISLCVGQTSWTGHVERAIRSSSLGAYFKVAVGQLDELRELVRQPRTDVERMMLEAIITIEVHARDVLQRLIDEAVRDVNDFNWISQLRYYWIVSGKIGDLKVRAVNAEFQYGYEYLGNNGRLVITPLTDRCYLTLTGALHLKFGGAPAGPAGTGKTETTKDLAKAFAIQCVVFNCSDQLDFMSMGKFFKGLASSGAWACFDEFNRIDVEVLSVIAQQIMTIQKAQQINADRFIFEGIELALKASCAVFITMNPGYAGRTELPDNLKALFRPVAMMVPNYALIAEISLFSCGFGQAKSLATKITATFKLSSEQLSAQDHYDFGMRSVKTVIAVAGNLKREQRDMDEQQICLKALRDVNVPKFLRDDLTLFNGIVSDLFPQVKEKEMDYAVFVEAIRASINQMGLAEVPAFIQKVIQLYETTVVRHGLMLVGGTGSGKTTCYRVLQGAFKLLKGTYQPSGKPFAPVHVYSVNPKSITMGQLYGEFDLATHEWTDGIFSSLLRHGADATDDFKRWYVFDGPVDAVWIENMNTVLDDNKKLCLTSGEIVRLTSAQTMMFEVEDLKVASPATVSRCGMVYFEPKDLGIEPLIDCWVKKLPEHVSEHSTMISRFARDLLLPGLRHLRDELKEIITSVDSGISQSYFNLMNCQIETVRNREDKTIFEQLIEPWSVFALVWSVGATCDGESRYIFSDWLRNYQKKSHHQLPLPDAGLVYDYKLIVTEGEEIAWDLWLDNDTTKVAINPEAKFSDIEVPTIDMVRTAFLTQYLLTNDCNVLSVGPTGSGKTLTITTKLSRDMPKKFICDFIIFSARTSANQTQDLIDSKLDKRRRGVYGPPISKRQLFFIDDLNMPALETYGAQPPIELLRQYMDYKGWYDRKEIGSFKTIEDVNFVCATAPPGGGRNPITARLLRHFHFIALPEMEDETKSSIFGTILSSWLSRGTSLNVHVKPLIAASLQIFTTLCKELLPTPDKCHYTFNVRDLGKVFQGMLMAEPERIRTLNDLILLWYHENLRVFRDRLVNAIDRRWFDRLIDKTLRETLDRDVGIDEREETLFYGNFCNPDGRYERIGNVKRMENTMLELLDEYNNSTTMPINLVLFEDAMSHVCRITRILTQSPGNALLLGMGGSGRQSLTKLSSHIVENNCFQIELTKAYSMRDWRDDVKNLLLGTGLSQRPSVFLFSDVQIKYDAFLEDINNILSSGDVPNIYQNEEMNNIFQAMRNNVQESGLQINRSNLLAAYRKVVRNNLHMVIAMCPIGEQFRARIRQFPALVNMCTIDWFDPWPDSALRSVAFHFLSTTTDEAITDDVLHSIVDTCQFMHSSVIKASEDFLQELNRHNYVTPTSYLELLSSYKDLLAKKKNELRAGIDRLSVGLRKLASTESEVKEMQVLLEKMKPELENATVLSAKTIEEISRDTKTAEIARAKAAEQEDEALKLKKINQAIRDDAEADLNTVRPMLEEAEASLQALNKSDITEVKAMKRPPTGVVLVIEAICIVKGVKPRKIAGDRPGEKLNDYWTPGSLMLSDAGQFLTSLANYNKEDITEDIVMKLKPYVKDPNFHPKKVMKVSKACHSLCMWLHAMYNYYFVNERVKPKMSALRKADDVLSITVSELANAMKKLDDIRDGLERLRERFRNEEERKAVLEAEMRLCEERMGRARRLVYGLADESERWYAKVADDEITLGKLIGDVLLCAGAVAYLTPFVDSYRKRLLTTWQESLNDGSVPHTPGREPVITLLGDPVEIRNWHLDGLPRDALSVDNAVLVANSRRWPLLVDPQGQAQRWLRNSGTRVPGGQSTVRLTDRDLLRVVENCVRLGRVCIIENVGLELEPALDTVLMRSLFRQAGQLCLKIGDNVVPYNDDFRLYLATKLHNPHYAPEIAVKVLIVNFSLTSSGLTDQMLSLVIINERPELEETRSSLLVASAQMKQELQQIEDRILLRLSLSEGSAVDDVDLIETLEASKIKSEEIKLKVESAETAQASIDAARSLYVPVAERAQVLFFCLLDLQLIDTMYQYSLEWFIRIFTNSMLNTEKNDDVNKRTKIVNDYFTFALYSNVCQSLFEKHKLHFAFLLCIRIQTMDNLIDRSEWKFLLSGAIPPSKEPNPSPNWLPQRCWDEILSLQVLPNFHGFVPSFKQLVQRFKIVFESHQPERTKLPEPWNNELNDLEKLLVLKCLRPDKLVNAIQIYVSKHLGSRFVEPQASGLDTMFKETSPTTPFIFILSSGTDPASELHKFAEKLKMSRKLYTISLGQGQGPRAELMLKQSIDAGNWVFFQNCHLAPSWMPNLEQLVEKLPPDDIHRDFRLWLTSMPSTSFPVSILQNGCKVTMEPPRGVKANMLRAYTNQASEMSDFIESEHTKVNNFKSLMFSLSLFHAVLLERRKFGPLGFNIPYEFTDGDYVICVSQLRMFLLEYANVPFKVLTYTAGHINYGGRITDDWDRRCVLTILESFYNISVLSTGHKFDDQGLYVQPDADTTLAEYASFIKKLPINDDPGLFGLHANANISYARAETYACLSSLDSLQPREISVAKKEDDDDGGVGKLAKRILDDLPKLFDLADIARRYPVLYTESLNTVLVQEATRYNDLLREMSNSLGSLIRALKGHVVMSETLETMALSLSGNKVPENWQRKAFASLKPLGAWFDDLKMRTKFVKDWHKHGIPTAFWISGFYFPQALLTGTLQNYARKYGLAIDTIDFTFQVLEAKPEKSPDDGCVVYGLFLEGCRWDGNYLAESLPRELFTEMAPIYFLPEYEHKTPTSGIYECPVYKTIKRAGTLSTTGHSTNFILSMEIPSRERQEHWIKRGVALVCSLDF